MKKQQIDFNVVPPEQRPIDRRLANWGRWCSGGWGAPSSCPMFRLTPPTPAPRRDVTTTGGAVSVDTADASKIASAVQGLPEKQRHALNWLYVRPGSPSRICSAIGVSMHGLFELIVSGRQMLINRGV